MGDSQSGWHKAVEVVTIGGDRVVIRPFLTEEESVRHHRDETKGTAVSSTPPKAQHTRPVSTSVLSRLVLRNLYKAPTHPQLRAGS